MNTEATNTDNITNCGYTVLPTVPYQKCPVCEGMRQIFVNQLDPYNTSSSIGYKLCHVCGGSGMIPMHVLPCNEVKYAQPLFTRIWEMPNKNTFDIKCIKKLIYKYFKDEYQSIDPFANKNRIAKVTNDLDPEMGTDYCMDALDFLKQFDDNSIDFVLYDPPYSPRQVSECYKKMGRTVNMRTTQSSFWGNLKKEIARITKPNGIVISFGWNTNGIGKTKGFEILEILIVAHGGQHNDTLCTVERKAQTLF